MARKKEGPVPLGDVVACYLASCEGVVGRGQGATALKVLTAFRKVGAPVTDHAEPVAFRAGVLTLVVAESGWLTELTFLRSELIEQLNRVLERPVVKDIRLRLGTVRAPRPVVRSARSLSPAQLAKVELWATEIRDPAVREAMMRAAASSLSRGPSPVPIASGPPGPRLTPSEVQLEPTLRYGYAHRSWDRWRKVTIDE